MKFKRGDKVKFKTNIGPPLVVLERYADKEYTSIHMIQFTYWNGTEFKVDRCYEDLLELDIQPHPYR